MGWRMGALHDPVDSLTQDLAANPAHDHRERVFLNHAAEYGVSHFAYVNTRMPQAHLHVETNYPQEWAARYLAQGYVGIDPVPLEARRSPIPFRWRDALTLPAHGEKAQHLFDEAAAFGLNDGYCVPIHGGGFSMMSLAVEDRALFGRTGMHRRQALHLLALQYHLACERALSAAAFPAPRLSPREREVLLWTAKGKTGWEIAQILHLAERTVTYHMENAKTKLGAASRAQAVVTALSLGLIRP